MSRCSRAAEVSPGTSSTEDGSAKTVLIVAELSQTHQSKQLPPTQLPQARKLLRSSAVSAHLSSVQLSVARGDIPRKSFFYTVHKMNGEKSTFGISKTAVR